MVSADHPLHDRLEGEERAGECTTDVGCHVGGCGGEVCSAMAHVSTTCEVLNVQWPQGRHCGCVDTRCQWWHASKRLEIPAPPKTAHDGVDRKGKGRIETGVSCGNARCKPGEECIQYYGIAGPNGPAFQQCGIRCDPGDPNACPQGKQCITIADGPGSVCR
jgi:eight-cysteine-cluster-containing protein